MNSPLLGRRRRGVPKAIKCWGIELVRGKVRYKTKRREEFRGLSLLQKGGPKRLGKNPKYNEQISEVTSRRAEGGDKVGEEISTPPGPS